MNIEQKRNSIRSAVLKKRENITPSERTALSKRITRNLIAWVEQHERSGQGLSLDAVMVYLSMKSEVETWELTDVLLKQNRQIIAPIVDTKSGHLIPKRIQNLNDDLVLHRFGMLEPKDSCPSFPTEKLNLILVPGITFDSNGYRLGYGKGFYDRFLPTCPNAVTIGLAFQNQLVDETFPQPWDVPVQLIATEAGFIS